MRKVVFIDVDGTLTNDIGVIPASAQLAIRKARENGHLIFICTGRSKGELFSEVLDVGFDGIVGAAGGYIEMRGEVLFHESVKKEDIQYLVEFFNKHKVDFKLESNVGVFAGGNMKQRMGGILDNLVVESPDGKLEIGKGLQQIHAALIEGEDLIREDINKVYFLGSDLPYETVEKELGSRFTITPGTVAMFGKNSGELSIPGIHKATAIAKVIQHLNISIKDTFAYGDSLNDVEMLEFVQHGIAMGNAREEVKKVADDVTDSHDENGIYNSFKKYGLI